jgi:Na+-transporting methylmalonyl-CoA/oxaloacetate decarboxylase gamma subunit
MKKTSLLLVILHLSVMVFSQEYKRKTPEEKAKKYTAEMAAEIHLENEQEAKIYLINVSVSTRFDSLYASKPEKDVLKKVTIELLRNRDTEFRKILTTEQFLRFDDIQREKREKKLKEKQEKELLEKAKISGDESK